MDKKEYVNRVFRLAMLYGMCNSLKEFAELLGVNRSGLSSAMNGNTANLTDKMTAKIQRFAIEHGIDEEAQGNGKPGEFGKTEQPQRQIVIPEETLELYTNLSETCRNLSAILARMGVPVADPVGKKDTSAEPGWMQK